jgi:AraC-like DNA-binding protein
MGNVCKPARFVTLTEDRPHDMNMGEVALVGQSGGVMIFVNQALEERGMLARYLITSGNEAGLQVADYIAFFASDPALKVIVVYVEAVADLARFVEACKLARAAGTSVRGLERAFDRDYGLSPRQYLRRLRMQTACQQLVSTRSTLAQVADRCGFADQSHFNRDFKRMTGMTPRAYRLKFVG